VSTWALAKPLLTMVLLPLIVGLMIRLYAAQLAARLFPVVKRTGGLFTLIVLLLTFLLYYRPMLDAVGSYVIAAEFLLLVGLAVLSYRAGFGLDRGQRSAMSLGMCTRNIAAVFVAYLAIPDPAPGIFVTLALVVPVTLVIASVAARVYAGRPGQGGVAADV
jgi:BASS family bile acid:Na+ symporter